LDSCFDAGEKLEPFGQLGFYKIMIRDEMLQRLRDEPVVWDVLVIGGGASGLATAVESAARGYRTALVEQADFAQATSSRSTKLIHCANLCANAAISSATHRTSSTGYRSFCRFTPGGNVRFTARA
jgi:predicted flavoprotein YhiN